MPEAEMLDTKRASSAYIWSAVYQQEPVPGEGNMFPMGWWKEWEVLPSQFDTMVQSWDFSFKDAKKADFVVGQVWARKGASFYLVDQIRARMSAKDSIEAIRVFTKKYPQARAKLFEDKANGPALKALLQHEVPGIIPINPKGRKEARAAAVAPFVQAGNVFIPKGAPWVSDFILELGQFPNGAHDDMVDAMSMALGYLAPGGFTSIRQAHQAGLVENAEKLDPQSIVHNRVWTAIRSAAKKKVQQSKGKVYKPTWNS